jgi:hypothetical protein
MGHQLPPRLHREAARATTPGADEPMVPEDGQVDQRDRIASPGASEPRAEDPPMTPATTSEQAAGIDLPQLERVIPMISYANQGKTVVVKLISKSSCYLRSPSF